MDTDIIKRLYFTYQESAKKRGHSFNLSIAQFFWLTQQPCVYCGAEPMQLAGTKAKPFFYNGVDRIQNDRGYEVGNCAPCCGVCNHMKYTQGPSDFITHAKMVAAHDHDYQRYLNPAILMDITAETVVQEISKDDIEAMIKYKAKELGLL